MIEVLKQMTEALEDITRLLQGITGGTFSKLDAAIQAGRQAISELEQRSIAELESQEPVAHWADCAVYSEPAYPKSECDCGGFNPVAWLVEDVDGLHLYWTYKQPIGKEKWTPPFSTPPQEQRSCDKRTWVGSGDLEDSNSYLNTGEKNNA